MNRTYDCPNCGGSVPFQSSIAVFAVCPFCRSMVVRHDVNVEAIGVQAALPPDLSPLQVGTQGQFEGLNFSLLGRVRLAYEEGSWNEWFAVFDDNRFGWVAEAQGVFMVSFASPLPEGFPSCEEANPGRLISIEGKAYEVTDRKEVTCLGSEGELPVAGTPGRTTTSLDLTGKDGEFASVEYSPEGTLLFVGRYEEFDNLNLSNLRPVPGWSEEAVEPTRGQTSALNCPKCGAAISLRAPGATMSVACPSCGSLLDSATPDLKFICRAEQRQRIKPRIPLGSRGALFGVFYEVIGFQFVKDDTSGWLEYLLFNPWQGFVWLVNYAGHWTFVRRLFERPTVDEGGLLSKVPHAHYRGESYRLFAVSSVQTEYVVGEFYWKVSLGMRTNVADFVCPPRILSRETYPNLAEVTWSQGEYIEPSVLEKAFGLESQMPERIGIYLNQPNPYARKARQLAWLAPLILLLLLGIQLFSAGRGARKEVLSASYVYEAGGTNPAVVTPTFAVEGGRQALDVVLEAPVDNRWFELGVDLVNADSQQTVATVQEEVAFYHGNDDGPWSEGGQSQHTLIPGVGPGRYRLVLDESADPGVGELPFKLTVVQGVVVWSNFWIGLGLLLIYPLYCWVRSYAFERSRWFDSDYSPYASTSDDDS